MLIGDSTVPCVYGVTQIFLVCDITSTSDFARTWRLYGTTNVFRVLC